MKKIFLFSLLGVSLTGCVSMPSEVRKSFTDVIKIMKEDPETVCKILIEKRGYRSEKEKTGCSKTINL